MALTWDAGYDTRRALKMRYEMWVEAIELMNDGLTGSQSAVP